MTGTVGEFVEDQEAAEVAQSPEQAADLAALAQSIADSDPLPGSPGEPEVVEPIMSFNDEAEMAVDLFADMAIAYEASVEKFWPASTRKRVVVALAAVLKKYNFSLLRSPELALIAVAGPVLFQTSKAIAQAMNGKADANG